MENISSQPDQAKEEAITVDLAVSPIEPSVEGKATSDNLLSSITSDELPSDHPLRWSWFRKHFCLVQVGLHAVSVGFTSAILAPGIHQVADTIDSTVNKALYTISIPLAFLSVSPFLWSPLANTFGRRPVLTYCMLLQCVSSLGAGYADSFGTLTTARVFQMCGASPGLVMGGAVVVDMFWQHERGRKMGIWTQMVTLGPALGGLVGGPLINAKGWRWSQWLCAIATGVQFLVYLFTFEETLYPARSTQHGNFLIRRFRIQRVPGSRFSPVVILKPLLFLQSPAVVICALAYAVCFAIASVGLATIIALPFNEYYGFNSTDDGLTYIAILVGVIVGEQASGPLSDWMMKRHVEAARANHQPIRLEYRLRAVLLGYVFVPVGLIMFGVSLDRKAPWIVPCLGMGIANAALQIVTTVLTTYCVDILSADALIVATFINFMRQIIAFTILFWGPPLCEKVGYGAGYGIEAAIVVTFCIPTALVYWKGETLRKKWPVRGL